ncbi:MAG: DUF4177 domain-containing protein [Paracoccaceae bacterium]
MPSFEYRVIAAPRKGKSAKGLRNGADRLAHAVELTLNEMADEGWDFQRAETLTAEERKGLTGKKLVEHTVLVFRRAVGQPEVAGKDDTAPAEAEAQLFSHKEPPLSRT